MKIISKEFWDLVLSKIVYIFTSVKIWVLIWTFFLVLDLYTVADKLMGFIILHPENVELVKTLSELVGKIYDISNALLMGVVVVIVLSRETMKYKRIKSGEHVKDD